MWTFGESLRRLRESRKLSQTELGKILGKTQTTIASYENGKNKPGPDTINKIADYFSVTSDYLLGRSSDPVQYTKEEERFIKDAEKFYTVNEMKEKYKLYSDSGEPLTDKEIEDAIKYVLFRRSMKS